MGFFLWEVPSEGMGGLLLLELSSSSEEDSSELEAYFCFFLNLSGSMVSFLMELL